MKKILLLLSISNLVVSCVSIPSSRMEKKMSSFKKEGMIAGTLSLEDKRSLSKYTLRFVQIQSGVEKNKFVDVFNTKKTNFAYNVGEIKFGYSEGDFKENGNDVYLFNIIKPSGKYRIFELETFHNSGSQLSQYSKRMPMDITFEIVEGEIKYLGEINISLKDQNVKLINNFKRDRMKFTEKNTAIIF